MLTKLSLLLLVFSIFTVAAKAQDFVASVRSSLDHNSFLEAQAKLKQYHDARGATPEYVEAYSWLGRKALEQKEYKTAQKFAAETLTLVRTELKKRALDAEPRLPTALGAAIEVNAQSMAGEGERHEAVQYLRTELARYSHSSLSTRIQKNINLLSLEGKLAPALLETQYLGPKPQPLTALKGKPVVLFFWSHWCVDCKAQAPVLARLKQEFPGQFTVVGPTQLYGYAAEGLDATPQQEIQYIDSVRNKYYSLLSDMSVPIAAENFREYGASTSPTMVILGSDGKVASYHPGRMTYEELKAQLTPLFVHR